MGRVHVAVLSVEVATPERRVEPVSKRKPKDRRDEPTWQPANERVIVKPSTDGHHYAFWQAQTHWMHRYLVGLWRGLEGHAHAAVGHGGHYNGAGSYVFETWEPVVRQWPEESRELAGTLAERSYEADVYVAVALRSDPASRKKNTALPGRYLWADVDYPDDQHRHRAAALVRTGCFAVASGSLGGIHLYVRLPELASVDVLESFNRRLRHYLAADDKWDASTVLRPPGSFWHKGRALNGEAPRLVAPLDLTTRVPGAVPRPLGGFSLEELDVILPPDVRPVPNNPGTGTGTVNATTLPTEEELAPEVLERVREDDRHPCTDGTRHQATYALMAWMAEHCHPPEHAVRAGSLHAPTRSKAAEKGRDVLEWAAEEAERVYAKRTGKTPARTVLRSPGRGGFDRWLRRITNACPPRSAYAQVWTVLAALFAEGRDCIGYRQLARRSGTSHLTAERATKWAEQQGWLEVEHVGTQGPGTQSANRYTARYPRTR
jgi:hypothetical protein